MGCGGSSPANAEGEEYSSSRNQKEDDASKALEEELERQQREENAIIKLLVLGTGESGKSTVFKQMKILYSVPDPPAKFIMICRANLFGNAQQVVDGMEKLGIEFKSDKGKAAGAKLKEAPPDGQVDDPPSFVQPLADLYEDGGVQEAIERAAEYQLNDSTRYFWEAAARLLDPGYLPGDQDVLRARVRTTGIVQQNFQIGADKYTMFDVGGQRNERRKWIHCFDNVTAVIFVTAISEYDQVLYEDETTNRMDEALTLFDQICNHPSFRKTSMILFLNKRDLFEMKLKKKDMSCWMPEAGAAGQDYDKCIAFIKDQFQMKNKDPEARQVYIHATCATDTENISFVMSSVFDIILKANLRALTKVDIQKLAEVSVGTGDLKGSGYDDTAPWANDTNFKIVLCCAWYSETLSERKVLVGADKLLPAVRLLNQAKVTDADFLWLQGLGQQLPDLGEPLPQEIGSFRGNFKVGARKLKEMLGTSESLGAPYDLQISTAAKDGKRTTCIVVVKSVKQVTAPSAAFSAVSHEEFEKAHYSAFDAAYDESKVTPPVQGAEFNPFAANPVGFRWFKGITLFTKEVSKQPDKGMYLGVLKVLSSTDGFKIMVNEHNRIAVPMIFLTESQLNSEDKKWVHGVRIREDQFKIDILEGKSPNMGWLGPEMSGEEGATFPEKLWWAIDEAKARLDCESIGKLYDKELIFVDEEEKLQLLLFGMAAKDENDILPGHIWTTREDLEVQNMKYTCPVVLQSIINKTQTKIAEYQILQAMQCEDVDKAKKLREDKTRMAADIENLHNSQAPLKWVNRVIEWCAAKMPSFGEGLKGANDSADDVVKKALAANSEIDMMNDARKQLLRQYKGSTPVQA